MRFGPFPLEDAPGAILAHSQAVPGGRLRKGRVLDRDDIAALRAAGLAQVIAARLDPGEVGEDAAAARLAAALVPDPATAGLRVTDATTGRVNLYATGPGVLRLDAGAVNALNRIDPMLTVATLPPFARVAAGTMVATIKVISYGVDGDALQRAEAAGQGAGQGVGQGAMAIAPVRLRSAGLILTEMPGQGPSPQKGETAIALRLDALGMELTETRVVAHDAEAIRQALRDLPGELVLILTASATSDVHDVAPAAVVGAGGRLTRYGMPVDPGNLLFLAELDDRPVIGLPGCARSPALNGADWVLERIACGIPVDDDAIAAMGVGGLLKESPARPHPREG
ncbi:molybdopterin biosynthesis protein [Mesobaculum littorinae]|uniref:Molybdopterin biosynthesis protein n=1 Tax=Mesobaculum littorinae TaxID=2486419 RepID=A0A438AJL6_9RHOB|nr:molybdopterin-binding protein [Mesobaculum littorinae]RVV98859.1 molybdopterin biosynthesis protein [Mesobaculum littorinae]